MILYRYCLLCIVFLSVGRMHAQWIQTLPSSVQDAILWSGDVEEGTLDDWTKEAFLYPGGGVFNTGEPKVEASVSSVITHTGSVSTFIK